jgi:hypothetical protein
VADWLIRLRTSFRQAPPLDLSPLLSLGLVFTLIGAMGRAIRGAWELATGAQLWSTPAAWPREGGPAWNDQDTISRDAGASSRL